MDDDERARVHQHGEDIDALRTAIRSLHTIYRPDHNGECLNCDEPLMGHHHAAGGQLFCVPRPGYPAVLRFAPDMRARITAAAQRLSLPMHTDCETGEITVTVASPMDAFALGGAMADQDG